VNECLTRRSFLQTTGLGLAACACHVRTVHAADAKNRIARRGVVPAALTPFDAELRIARNEFRRHIEALSAVPGVRMKYALKRIGRWENEAVRPPLRPLDDAERAAIDRALRESGLA
jgi:dihydrodipicolinate synthase/N-acetylneuraminate lyase